METMVLDYEYIVAELKSMGYSLEELDALSLRDTIELIKDFNIEVDRAIKKATE